MTYADDFGDQLVGPDGPEQHERFFDRFVFNLHPADHGTTPSLVFGHGLYPARDVADGFVVATLGDEQRNLRWSTELSASDWRSAGPFGFEVTSPMQEWRLRLADNPSGVAFDLTWRARTPAWSGQVGVENASGGSTAFDHLFQSGRYDGWLAIDGAKQDVAGWWGQRDRSRGVRTMSGGQGLHVWLQAQLADRSVGFLLVQARDHARVLLEGAVMHEDGTLDAIVDVRHALEFDEFLDLAGGQVQVTTASGEEYEIECDASARGGYLAGGGYGGHHGSPLGVDHVEHDRYPLDGSITPISLDTPLTDRQTRFVCAGEQGSGIFEFAHSRSSRYVYEATLA